ncbi:MAG: hypothetical protein R3Y64_00580 [Peptostreptococcaceae bacterium]
MRSINLINRSIIFLVIISVMYTGLDFDVLMLAPIFTVVIPYYILKDGVNNDKTYKSLLTFNTLTFYLSMVILDKTSISLGNIVINLLISLIYFIVVSKLEYNKNILINDPQKIHVKLVKRKESMEKLLDKMEETMSESKDDRTKESMKQKEIELKLKLHNLENEIKEVENIINLQKK